MPLASQLPSQPMHSQAMGMPAPSGGANRVVLFAGIGALVVAGLGFFFLAGPKTGSIAVSVAGPGGKALTGVVVSIDGADACSDSVCSVAELEKGTHRVSAAAPGYQTSAPKLVQVKAGEESVLNIELEPEAQKTLLRVSTKASGLSLKVDGKDIGPLPQDLAGLEPGNHEVEISGSPYIKPFKKTISLRAEENLSFEPELELAKGQLTVTAGEGADGAKILLVGGGKRLEVKKDKLPLKVEIPADQEFKLVATRRGYDDYEEQISFSVSEPQKTYEVTLEKSGSSSASSSSSRTTSTSSSSSSSSSSASSAAKGTLNINSIPVSQVILDGRPLGTTPKLGVSVSAGKHTVVFVHPEHGRKSSTVNVTAGGTATAAVRFP